MPDITPPDKNSLIKHLLQNDISLQDLLLLCTLVESADLSNVIQHIYDLNETSILSIAALSGLMKFFDNIKNTRRNSLFTKKLLTGKWDKSKESQHRKIVLAEGDSWFNYPVVLTDVVDTISMDPDLAVYSLAKGGYWLLDILTGRHYIEQLSILFPDFFLISGGGNDIVGARRLAAIVQSKHDPKAFNENEYANMLKDKANTTYIDRDNRRFDEGVGYLSKDFFALLMFFRLQYYFLFNGILNGGSTKQTKFPGIKIMTQGYDYPIPDISKGFGLNPLKWYIPFVRLFLGHGTWLKIPLQIRGITIPETQRNICYAMIYLFNEMMIETGRFFNNQFKRRRVFHIDSRGSVGINGWTDELHAQPNHFIDTGRVFRECIHHCPQGATYEHVYVVEKIAKNLKP